MQHEIFKCLLGILICVAVFTAVHARVVRTDVAAFNAVASLSQNRTRKWKQPTPLPTFPHSTAEYSASNLDRDSLTLKSADLLSLCSFL